MAQQYSDHLSLLRGEKPRDPEPELKENPRLYVHDDQLSRYIDDILDGKRPPVSVSRQRANGWPDDFRGWLIFAAMMALAIWGIVKISLL